MSNNRINLESWLNEVDLPASGQPDPAGMTTPTQQPDYADANNKDINVTNTDQKTNPELTQDNPDGEENTPPKSPDMPEEGNEKDDVDDFELWKKKYIKESINASAEDLLDMLHQMRDREKELSSYQRKFVDDNINIQIIRQNVNVEKVCKEIKKSIRNQLDKNNPATSVVSHMFASLEGMSNLTNIFIKLNGYSGMKGDLHRKFIAALLGSVQVGSGGNNEDLIYNEKEYSILLSTRFNSKWGDVLLGNWSLTEGDAARFLTEPELKRLRNGSPQEKDVLRRRIIMESISSMFETRAFIINVVSDDGTIYTLGWDLSSSLKSAYTDGRLVVKTELNDKSESAITDKGEIIPFMDINIYYVKKTGRTKDDGLPEYEEYPFIQRKHGNLFLVASQEIIKEAAHAMVGAIFKETPYNGNPSDLDVLRRCVFTANDLIMRTC